jgi:hypothetical protein
MAWYKERRRGEQREEVSIKDYGESSGLSD